MGEDRIQSEITVAYKATNSKGQVTLEVKPVTVIVKDQSPEAASGHLISIVTGILGPAKNQVEDKC